MKWVIWSEEHGGWWLPNKWGYTRELDKAGRYSDEEANEIVTNANKYPPRGMKWCEVAFPDPLVSSRRNT